MKMGNIGWSMFGVLALAFAKRCSWLTANHYVDMQMSKHRMSMLWSLTSRMKCCMVYS